MLIARVLFGMAEGPVSAAGNKIINNWISRKEFATAIGILAPVPARRRGVRPIVGLLALSLGWRPAFGIIFLFGPPGTLWRTFIVSDKPIRVNARRRKNALILKIMVTLFYLMMAGLRLHSAIT